MSLTGKVLLITGGTKGIGRSTVLRAASLGASVVFSYISPNSSATASEITTQIGDPSRVLAIQADASKLEEIDKLVNAAVERFGKIDIVVPNAGIMGMIDLAHATEESYDAHFNLNVKGALFLVQKAVPHFPPSGGRVIFISTGLNTASGVSPGYLIYVATKGAIDQMTRALSKDLAKKNITVNAVAPGPTGTDLFFEGKSEQIVNFLKNQSPFGRLGEPEEIADVILFLASEESKWVSGQIIRVNGANMV
ncbi:hypothetical protein QBC40DRAFT_280777 [Triangularia verruculosa]|uniref:Uncharacterized protein n=1 Tax=Triangularia verruculosa TaxID=2587418 RepID=A0AAN6XLQ7_9PEZI|nr:hypothetical protein QBC40DRAFT_280777 [Triangularia verruculosa]